MLDSDVNLF